MARSGTANADRNFGSNGFPGRSGVVQSIPNFARKIEEGSVEIVEKETFPVKDHERRPIQRDILKGATKLARRVVKKYGVENLGPWDDFEWGMINGKLSALRWVLGEDWDELYT